MNKRARTIFLSLMLIVALSISLIPIYPNSNSYAETQSTEWGIDVLENMVQVDIDGYTAMGLDINGNLYAWGNNECGQLGDGTFVGSNVPVIIMDHVKSFDISGRGAYAIKTDGSLWRWGYNWFGHVGNGTTNKQNTPLKVMDDVSSACVTETATYAVQENGTLWAWGWNIGGQLGDGTSNDSYIPKMVMGNVSSVTSDTGNAFAILTDGSLWGWGQNDAGQLGNGTSLDSATPIKIMENTTYARQKYGTVYALKSDGTMWAWGSNYAGQVGNGSTVDQHTPLQVLTDVSSISTNGMTTLAVQSDGSLWGWGEYYSAISENGLSPSEIMDDVLSASHDAGFFAIKYDGSLWSWGASNGNGLLGDGNNDDRTEPLQIMENVKMVSCSNSAYAIKEDGSLWSWGSGYDGQLGNGKDESSSSPVSIPQYKFESTSDFVEIPSNLTYNSEFRSLYEDNASIFGLQNDGSLWSWGNNDCGQLGNGTTINRGTRLKILDDVVSFRIQNSTAFAIKSDGSLWSWGENSSGQTGDGTFDLQPTPQKILDNVISLEIRNLSVYAIQTDGSLWGWGDNADGRLGIGTTDIQPSPVEVMDDVKFINASFYCGYAIKNDNSLWSWGANSFGELGDGTTTAKSTPVKVMDNVQTVEGKAGSTYAILTDGSLWSWGYNNGKLGDGGTANRSLPFKIMDNVLEVNHGTFAIQTDGSLWAWGSNPYGILGDGTQTKRLSPVKIMDNVKTIYHNGESAHAIQNDGSLWSWGYNGSGHLGDGTTVNRYSPVKIMDNVVSVDGTGVSASAIKTDGSLWSWGYNGDGRVGDGTTINRLSPVKILDGVALPAGENVVMDNSVSKSSQASFNLRSISSLAPLNSLAGAGSTLEMDGVTFLPGVGGSAFSVKSNGSLWSWGNNESGQLGNGTNVNQYSPITVDQTILLDGDPMPNISLTCDTAVQVGFESQPPNFDGTLRYSIADQNPQNAITISEDGLVKTLSCGTATIWATNMAGDISYGEIYVTGVPKPEIAGISDGATFSSKVPIFFKYGIASLNGQTIESGTMVTENGEYDLAIANLSGGQYRSIHFTVAIEKPSIQIEPYASFPTNQDITVYASSSDGILDQASHTFTRNGNFTFVARNDVGNVSLKTITITNIDKTPPTITGASDNANYDVDVTIGFNEGTGMLNGEPFESGSTIYVDGTYELVVTDEAGNSSSVGFTIDKPFEINGVADNGIYNHSVDIQFNEGEATLNEVPIGNSCKVTEDGQYTLMVKDALGTSHILSFVIDTIAPGITIEPYQTDPTNQSIMVNASCSGGTLNASTHTFDRNGSFTFTATDQAGNVSSITVNITNIFFSVIFDSRGGSDIDPINTDYGATITMPSAPSKNGYDFDGWYEDDSCLNGWDFASEKVTANTMLYAKWILLHYSISYYTNGGINNAFNNSAFTVESQGIDLLAPTRAGCSFGGWYDNAELSGTPVDFIPAGSTGDKSYYAKWVINQYPVTFNSQGGSVISSTTANYDTMISEPAAPTRTGYAFAGWYKETACTNAWYFGVDKVTTATTLYAKWIINKYNIKFNANGGSGTMTTQPMTYNVSGTLQTNLFKKTGYVFLGWAKTSTGSVAYKDKASVKNLSSENGATVNLYAKWGAPITSAVSYSYNSVKVSWAAAGSATSYKIYRATSSSGTYSLVKTAASTSRSWIDTGRVTGKNYYYKIYPVVGGSTYKFSTYKSVKAVPATPSVTLTKASSTSIKVAWNGVPGATKYLVYRAGKSSNSNTYGDYTLVHTASSADRSWINTGRTFGSTYKYKVRVYHLEGTTKVYGSFSAVKYWEM